MLYITASSVCHKLLHPNIGENTKKASGETAWSQLSEQKMRLLKYPWWLSI